MAHNAFQKHEQTVQELQNRGFDPTFDVPTAEILGFDDGNNVLRRIAVDSDGKLELTANVDIDTTDLATETTLGSINTNIDNVVYSESDSPATNIGVLGMTVSTEDYSIKPIRQTADGILVDMWGTYTEGDEDASITGVPVLWEDTSNILRAASVAKPLPVYSVPKTNMEGGGKVSVGTTQVEVTFTGTPKSIIIQADKDNTGLLFVGKTGVTNAGANAFCFLEAGRSVTLDYDDTSNAIYVISDTASQNFWKGALL